MNTELIKLKEVSRMTSLPTSTLRTMIKRNELKGVLIGNNYYVRPNDYMEFIFGIECKKLGIPLEDVPKVKEYLLKEKEIEGQKQLESLINSMG